VIVRAPAATPESFDKIADPLDFKNTSAAANREFAGTSTLLSVRVAQGLHTALLEILTRVPYPAPQFLGRRFVPPIARPAACSPS